MQSSLGIFIEKNMIKYAKLQKDKDLVKIESYNTAFYDNNLTETISKIISETYSFKTPISINTSDEIYNISAASSLLSQNDLKKAINIDFEVLCSERGYNKNELSHRYLITEESGNPDVRRVVNIISNKLKLQKNIEAFQGNKINTISPISVSIRNLLETTGRENIAILNIEGKTQLTTIFGGQIYQIDDIDYGMEQILSEINKTENSLSKSYEVCKNATIYTQGASELYSETSDYVGIITEVLYNIANKVKEITELFFSGVDKIYITGSGTCINNIDLFFQENIQSTKFELLKPYFVNSSNTQIPVKEYMEVNSAIALALDGLGMIDKNVNFVKGTKVQNKTSAKNFFNQDISFNTIKDMLINFGSSIKNDFGSPLDSGDKLILRGMISCLIIVLLFTLFSNVITNKIDKKQTEVSKALETTNIEIGKLNSDIQTISNRTDTYKALISDITEGPKDDNTQSTTRKRIIEKDSIPNLLNRIMVVIPKKVKVISITNTTSKHIQIVAESEKYEQLGYFKAVLTTNGILTEVKSTNAEKVDSVIRVTIEGDLP